MPLDFCLLGIHSDNCQHLLCGVHVFSIQLSNCIHLCQLQESPFYLQTLSKKLESNTMKPFRDKLERNTLCKKSRKIKFTFTKGSEKSNKDKDIGHFGTKSLKRIDIVQTKESDVNFERFRSHFLLEILILQPVIST